jgi:dienelactone hydrolase
LVILGCLLAGAAQAADYREQNIPLTLDDGRTLTAQLRLPLDAQGRLPALMLFGGFRNAGTVLDRVHTDKPVIWASFDYPFEAPRKFHFPGSLKLAPQMRAAIHGTFDGVGKLYAALKAHPQIDPARITVVGASAGAPFATVGAARHPIPGVILVQGFGDVTRVVQNLIVRKYRPKYGEWVKWPALLLAQWITWYCEIPDIAEHARSLRVNQKVLLFTAAEDDFIPREASEALWTALQESRSLHERIEFGGGHLGVGDDTQQIADILQRALAWMENNGLL